MLYRKDTKHLSKDTFMLYCEKAKDIKDKSYSFAKELTDETLQLAIQSWIDSENKNRGYLVGLSPQCNVTQFSEILNVCSCCYGGKKPCQMANIVRNLASCESICNLLEESNDVLKKDAAIDIVEKLYPPYALLREYVTRNCKGQWLTF